jgi:hypothetical protein
MLRLVEFGAHPCNRAQNSDPALEPRDQLAGNRKAVLHLEPSPISHERPVSVGGGERTADALQRFALSRNREERGHQCRGEHQHRAEQVAAEKAPA